MKSAGTVGTPCTTEGCLLKGEAWEDAKHFAAETAALPAYDRQKSSASLKELV